jgi:hypothetical protein
MNVSDNSFVSFFFFCLQKSAVSQWEIEYLIKEVNTEIAELQARMAKDAQRKRCVSSDSGTAIHSETNKANSSNPPRFELVKSKSQVGLSKKVSHLPTSVSGGAANSVENQPVPISQEIGRLLQQAGQLQDELEAMQRNCLQRLNKVVLSVPDSICIPPSRFSKRHQ